MPAIFNVKVLLKTSTLLILNTFYIKISFKKLVGV